MLFALSPRCQNESRPYYDLLAGIQHAGPSQDEDAALPEAAMRHALTLS